MENRVIFKYQTSRDFFPFDLQYIYIYILYNEGFTHSYFFNMNNKIQIKLILGSKTRKLNSIIAENLWKLVFTAVTGYSNEIS